ncbi:hypothetical protein FRC20_008119 [Serendipita sp. 405]|nr:hypothetical protein FRC20_008119 [Serendipita sp. 405]
MSSQKIQETFLPRLPQQGLFTQFESPLLSPAAPPSSLEAVGQGRRRRAPDTSEIIEVDSSPSPPDSPILAQSARAKRRKTLPLSSDSETPPSSPSLFPSDTQDQQLLADESCPTYAVDRNHCLDGVTVVPQLKALICRVCKYVVPASFIQRHFNTRNDDHPHITLANLATVLKAFEIEPNNNVPPPPPAKCRPIEDLALMTRYHCDFCQSEFNKGSRAHENHKCDSSFLRGRYENTWTSKIQLEVVVGEEAEAAGELTTTPFLLEAYNAIVQRKVKGETIGSEASRVHPFYSRLGFDHFLSDIPSTELNRMRELIDLKGEDRKISVAMQLCHNTLKQTHRYLLQPASFVFRDALTDDDGEAGKLNAKNEINAFHDDTYIRYTRRAYSLIHFVLQTYKMSPNQRRYWLTESHTVAIVRYSTFLDTLPQGSEATKSQEFSDEQRLEVVLFLGAFLTDSYLTSSGTETFGQAMHPVMAYLLYSVISFRQLSAAPAPVTQIIAMLKWTTSMVVFAKHLYTISDMKKLASAVQEDAHLYLRKGGIYVYSWLQRASSIAMDSQQELSDARFIFLGEERFLVDGQEVQITDWKAMVRHVNSRVEETFQNLCLCVGMKPEDLDLPDAIIDVPTETDPGYWFFQERRNGLNQRFESFIKQIIKQQIFYQDGKQNHPNISAFTKLKELDWEFLASLQAALYFTGGQPPRGDNDIWSARYVNTQYSKRNIHIYDRRVVYVSEVEKSIWRTGHGKAVPHIYPTPAPTTQVLKYLIYFRNLSTLLIELEPNIFPSMSLSDTSHLLFNSFGRSFGTSDFSAYTKKITSQFLKISSGGFGISLCRQLSAYIAKRFILPQANTEHGDTLLAIFDLQQGHTSEVARRFYGVEAGELPSRLQNDVYIKFQIASFLHHHFYELEDHSSFLSSKGLSLDGNPDGQSRTVAPAVSITPKGNWTSDLQLGSSLLSPLAKKLAECMEKSMSTLSAFKGSHSAVANLISSIPTVADIPSDLLQGLFSLGFCRFKSETQAVATVTFYLQRHDLLCVMPTGGGKSLIYQVVASTFKQHTIVVIFPYQALAEDQYQAAKRLGLRCQLYTPEMSWSNPPPLIFVVLETSVTSGFMSYIRTLVGVQNLFAIVLDEAHLFLSHRQASFRKAFAQLPTTIGTLSVPFLMLSGSLPPSEEETLRRKLNRPTKMNVVRQPCNCHNIAYRVDRTCLDWDHPRGIQDYIWRVVSNDALAQRRVLVFVPTKKLIEQLMKIVDHNQYLFIHSELSRTVQQATINSWGKNGEKNILLSTNLIGTGIDLEGVRLVLHLFLPTSGNEWFQETGRAGRNGEAAQAILNTTLPPYLPPEQEDEEASDRAVLRVIAEAETCRGVIIRSHFDGSGSVCLAACSALCDVCQAQVEGLNPQAETSIQQSCAQLDLTQRDALLASKGSASLKEEEPEAAALGHPHLQAHDFFSFDRTTNMEERDHQASQPETKGFSFSSDRSVASKSHTAEPSVKPLNSAPP